MPTSPIDESKWKEDLIPTPPWKVSNTDLETFLSVTINYYKPATLQAYYELYKIIPFIQKIKNDQHTLATSITYKQLQSINISLAIQNIWWIIFGVFMSFWHSWASNIAYYLHKPNIISWDIGFILLPENDSNSVREFTEILFWIIVIMGILYMFIPFYVKHQKIISISIFARYGKVSGFLILLRTLSFLSTSMPGPSQECLPGSTDYDPPKNWNEIFFTLTTINGCGDLIFSGHLSLSLTIAIIISHYSYYIFPKYWKHIAFIMCIMEIVMMFLIIIIRNHYTVDIIVALYTTPLVYYCAWYIFPDSIVKFDSISKKFIS